MKTRIIFGLLLATVLMSIGCSEDSNDGNFEETGRLTVRLTDAPFPYDMVSEANVTVFKVEARRAMEDNTDESSPFVVLMETEIDVNLLNLTNGTTEMLADLEIPVGAYDLVRVYVKGINVLLTDGRTFDLKVPSGEQTGIKVFIKPSLTVAGGLSSDLLLDFDVSRSFVAKGGTDKVENITGFNFKPVIKASNMSTAGTLAGNISSVLEDLSTPVEGTQISVFAADTLNTTAYTDVDGNYAVMGLGAGAFKVFAEKEGYLPSDTLNIEIVAANRTIQDFILKAATVSESE